MVNQGFYTLSTCPETWLALRLLSYPYLMYEFCFTSTITVTDADTGSLYSQQRTWHCVRLKGL